MRFLFTPWGLILQGLALIHFIRRRPDMYWLWIIIFLGPLGAGIYILMEVIPDLGVLRQSFDAFPRRKRIRQLEALVLDNPAACASPIFVGSKTDWKQNVIKEYFWSGLVLIVVFNLGRQRLQPLMPQCRRISVLPLQSARDKQRPDQMPD